MKQVFKWRVPVDGEEHEVVLPVGARIIHVAAQTPYAVEFWTESFQAGMLRRIHTFRVVETGGTVQEDWSHVGTALVRSVDLVWHLYEKGT